MIAITIVITTPTTTKPTSSFGYGSHEKARVDGRLRPPALSEVEVSSEQSEPASFTEPATPLKACLHQADGDPLPLRCTVGSAKASSP